MDSKEVGKSLGFYEGKIKRKMNKLTIYIARFNPSRKFSGPSAPCKSCMCKIKEIGIKKIVYCDRVGNIKKCLTKDYHTDYMTPGYSEYKKNNIKVI